jgi:hypothetical protein
MSAFGGLGNSCGIASLGRERRGAVSVLGQDLVLLVHCFLIFPGLFPRRLVSCAAESFFGLRFQGLGLCVSGKAVTRMCEFSSGTGFD